ncbi:gamma-butyrobetaine hydroxylase-like domain-containing protein [Parashewanella tropica]|uniref:gamma-butyrobetaine hydroxylase-like domain-containing protein n=1 Tax=Parashewanella tropica TaxID=2547970 RepID=UPI0010596A29|nr:gamma-butyrobetaine hydroxylase-like domain-containing protein [Parashewanella tropica]
MEHTPKVTHLKLKRKSRVLEIAFDGGEVHSLSCEFLRVYSPSAEVQQHGNPVLVTHKKNVNISAIETVGHYAVKLVFDDGHDSGIYSWALLYQFTKDYQELWQSYLTRLKDNHGSREALIPMAVKYTP